MMAVLRQMKTLTTMRQMICAHQTRKEAFRTQADLRVLLQGLLALQKQVLQPEEAKADLELGLSGVGKALDVLRDYYGGASLIQDDAAFVQQPAKPEKHSQKTGAGQSIIGILEVCESDFSDNLAKEEMAESDAASEYEKITQENKVAKTTKDQDVKYKTQEFKSLDKEIAELTGDKDTLSTELGAVNEYYSKLRERCVAKPESYEDRKARREEEINGLKEALQTLEEETAFVQRKRKGGLRGHIGF